MDITAPHSTSVSVTPIDPSEELTHITQEMYKKNFELAEINKTLSLLRKIDEIILSRVTESNQIAQQVCDIVTPEANFKALAIYLVDQANGKLMNIGLSKTVLIEKTLSLTKKAMYPPEILLSETTNSIAKSVINKIQIITHSLHDFLLPYNTPEEVQSITGLEEIKSTLIYPLIVRDTAIGALIINLGESEETLFQFQHTLIDRLSGIIGIAIYNSLLYQDIQKANERLKSLDKLKDEFVSLASHELRTPMTAIKSYLWLVLQQREDLGRLTDKQKVYLERTYQSTERLIKLVNDMLNVSRIESGRMKVNMSQVNLVQLANEVLGEVLPTAQNLQIEITIDEPVEPLPLVSADPEKIKEVIINLIGNSLKFTPKEGKIHVSFDREQSFIWTKVTDTGKGIKPEDQGKLFQKFGMIEGNYVGISTNQGTGLGLYITKSIIQLHGGTITMSSAGENKGTTFAFSLKIA